VKGQFYTALSVWRSIVTIDRRVRLSLSKWSSTGVLREGHGDESFSA